jgi:hypothetical protein
VLFAVVQITPPLLTGLVTLYVLVLVPSLEGLIPSQVATHVFHSLQSPAQLTEQSVFMHVLSVSVVLFAILHVPPLIAFVLTLYVLVLVPCPGAVVLTPSQVATQAVQLPQSPIQLTGQFVLLHVKSICCVLFAIGQVLPLLLTGLVTIYVLVFVPGLGAVALIPSQVASQSVQEFQSPTQSTGQSVLLHV